MASLKQLTEVGPPPPLATSSLTGPTTPATFWRIERPLLCESMFSNASRLSRREEQGEDLHTSRGKGCGFFYLETGIGGVKSPQIRGGVKILNFQGPLNLTLLYRDSTENRQFGGQKSKFSRGNFRSEFPPPSSVRYVLTPPIPVSDLLTVGSFLLTVALFYLQLTTLAFLLTVGAFLLTVLASLLTVGAFFA